MNRVIGPVPTFVLLTAVIAEVGSSNVTPSAFIQPGTAIVLLTIAYGMPLLILREMFVAKGFAALIPAGLAYGVINEGILAKTILLTTALPLPSFDGYGVLGGISTGWAALILVWHLVNSLLGPLALTYLLFPDRRDGRWLSDRWLAALVALQVIGGAAIFFTDQPGRAAGSLAHFAVLAAAFAALLAVAFQMPRQPVFSDDRGGVLKPFLVGAAMFLGLMLFPTLLAEFKVPLAVYFAWMAIICGILIRLLLRRESIPVQTLAAIAMGNTAAQSLWLLLIWSPRAEPERTLTATVFLLGSLCVAWRLRRPRGAV